MQKMTWCRFGIGAIKTIAAMILKEERDRLTKRAEAAEREASTWQARAQDGMTTISRAVEQLRDAEGKRDENWELYQRILRENHELTNEIVDLKLVRDTQNEKLEELRESLKIANGLNKEYCDRLVELQKKFDEADRRRSDALLALGRLSAFASNRIGYDLGRGLPDDHELRIQAVIDRLSRRGVG